MTSPRMNVVGPSKSVQYVGKPANESMPVIRTPNARVTYAKKRMIGAYRYTSVEMTIASPPKIA